MRLIKRRIETFAFYDPKGIEAHLEKMAANGWMLDDITSIFWVYKRMEPSKLQFNVTYFNSASDFDPSPSNEQWTFYDYCRDAGWQFVASQQVMQVFYSTDEDPTPIETDAASSLATIHEAFKKKVLYANIALILYSFFQLYLQYQSLNRDLGRNLSNYGTLLAIPIFIILPLLAALKIIGYGFWYYKAKGSVERKNSYDERPKIFAYLRRLDQLLMAIIILLVVVFTLTSTWGFFLPLGIGVVFLIYTCVVHIRKLLKDANVSKDANQVTTGIITVLLSFVTIPLLGMVIIPIMNSSSDSITYSYTNDNGTKVSYEVYNDELPLDIGDIKDESSFMYSKEYRRLHTLLSTYIEGSQTSVPFDSDGPWLSYNVYIVHVPSLIEPVLDSTMNQYTNFLSPEELEEIQRAFIPVDPTPWEADEAYQLKDSSGLKDSYIIRWDNRIAELRTSFPLDKAILSTLQKKLRDIS